jgi:hypothetical protein
MAVIRQALEEESMSLTQKFQTPRARQVKSKIKGMLIISLTSRELFTKNSSWQAKLSIPHITVMFYSDLVKMCEDFALKFGDKMTGCCIMTTHHLALPFSPGNLCPKTTSLLSTTHPTFFFPQSRIKLKDCHFDTIQVIKAESQVALKTLTEHGFQDTF